MRIIFSTVRAPQDPAFTVESLAMTQTGRPLMRPIPVTTPSAGRPSARALANNPSSHSTSPSKRSSNRRRTNSLFCFSNFSWYFGAPPRLILSVCSSHFLIVDSCMVPLLVPSFPPVDGFPLFLEGLQAFQAILGGNQSLVGLGLDHQAGGQIRFHPVIDGELGLGQGQGGVFIDHLRHFEGGIQHLTLGYHMIDQADPLRFGGIDSASGKNQLLRHGLSDNPGQALRPPGSRDNSQGSLRQPENRPLIRQPQIAGQGQLHPAAQGDTVYGGDHRPGQSFDRREGFTDQMDVSSNLILRKG